MGRKNPFSTVPQLRTITAGLGLAGGGDLSQNRTVSLATKQIIAGGDFDGVMAAATMIDAVWSKTVSATLRTYTTDTAVNIIAALGAGLGRWFDFTLSTTGGAFDLVLGAGAGVTLIGDASNYAFQTSSRSFRCIVTSASTVSIVRL